MAVTLVISCPECKSEIKAPAELAGKKIRCKKCGATFPVKAPAAAKPAAKAVPAKPAGKAKPAAPVKPAGKPRTAPPAQPAAPAAPDEYEDGHNPYIVTHLDMTPRCPHCAHELESEDAILCIGCGYNLQTREHARTRKTVARTPVDRILWLLPGVFCVGVIFALIGGDLFFWFGLEDTWKDMDGDENKYSYGIRVWVIIISAIIMWFLARFAFRRLILHPTPPEIEKN